MKNTFNCVTVPSVRGHLTLKMNIAFFIRNLMLNIFLFDNFFEKSCIFWENRKKLFWGRIWQFVRERRRLTPKINVTFLSQMRYWIFYYLAVFSKKKNCIFWENSEKPFLGPKSLLKGRGGLAWKMNITFFNGKWSFEYFSFNNFFEKGNIFGENGEKNFRGTRLFFRRGHLTLKMNITFFIKKLDATYFHVK